MASYEGLAHTPACPSCRALLRPAVVLFGERLPSEKLELLQLQLERGFDVVVNVGTTAVFTYIARPTWLAEQAGALTVEVDPGETRLVRS